MPTPAQIETRTDNSEVNYVTVQRCSITGAHAWSGDECTTCGARIRRDLPTREQVRSFHAARKSVRS